MEKRREREEAESHEIVARKERGLTERRRKRKRKTRKERRKRKGKETEKRRKKRKRIRKRNEKSLKQFQKKEKMWRTTIRVRSGESNCPAWYAFY